MKNATVRTSLLEGRQLRLVRILGSIPIHRDFHISPSYTIEKDGKKTTVDIDYTISLIDKVEVDDPDHPGTKKEIFGGEYLANQLNEALKQSGIQSDGGPFPRL